MRRRSKRYDRVVHVGGIGGAEAAELRSIGFARSQRGDVGPRKVRSATDDQNVPRKNAGGDLAEGFVEDVEDLGREEDVSVEVAVESAGKREILQFGEEGADVREVEWVRFEVGDTGDSGLGRCFRISRVYGTRRIALSTVALKIRFIIGKNHRSHTGTQF